MAFQRRPRSRDNVRTYRPKICRFCEENINYVDFKDSSTLTRYITEKGKIIPKRITGTCANHQKILRKAIVRARGIALLQ